jgi:hypothetical protein
MIAQGSAACFISPMIVIGNFFYQKCLHFTAKQCESWHARNGTVTVGPAEGRTLQNGEPSAYRRDVVLWNVKREPGGHRQ